MDYVLVMLMASPSSFSDSSDDGRTIFDREITPIGETSSSKLIESLFNEGEHTKGTSSPSHASGSHNHRSNSSCCFCNGTNPFSKKRKTQNL